MKNSCTYSWRKPPADARSKSGKIVAKTRQQVGAARDLVRHRPDERCEERAHEAEADPPREGPRQLVAERPADRAAHAEDVRRQAGERETGRDAEVAAHEQLDPDREEDAPPTTPTSASPAQSYSPTSAMWSAVQRNGLRAATGPRTSRPLATHRTTMTRPATPAAPERPRSGARANARPPKNRAMKPTHRAKPTDESGGIGSPSAASPNSFELTVVATARIAIASPSIVRWAASFSSAIRRLPNGAAATKSRLPRRASPARVEDRARIDHSAVPRAKMAPYFQVM